MRAGLIFGMLHILMSCYFRFWAVTRAEYIHSRYYVYIPLIYWVSQDDCDFLNDCNSVSFQDIYNILKVRSLLEVPILCCLEIFEIGQEIKISQILEKRFPEICNK